MGDFNPEKDRGCIHDGDVTVVGVSDTDQACAAARELYEKGVGCIELCGAFGASGAKKIIAATDGNIPVGYVTHLKEQDELYRAVFGEK